MWQSNLSSLSNDLSNLIPANSEQQAFLSKTKDDLEQLNVGFSDLVSFLEAAPRNVSVRVMPEFQNDWDRIVNQYQAFSLDASQLSHSIRVQADQLSLTNMVLVLALLVAFGAFFLTTYAIFYRRTLKSISNLQSGINTIGSGNLDFSINADKKDEIGSLSSSFNQMTANLKSVTASKKELEKEIAERKKAEVALAESEKRLNRSQEIAHLGSWELDLINNSLTWSDEVFRIFGLKPQEFGATYEAFLDAVHPEDRAAVDAAYSGSLREGKDTYEIEHRIVRKPTGEIRLVHEKCYHIRDPSGKIIRSIGMVNDITERKKAEEALLQSEKKYRRLYETSQDGIMARDLQGRMIDCNQAYARMLGYSKLELEHLTPQELIPKKWHEQREKIVKDVQENGGSIIFEREYRRKDGSIFPASVRTWRITDEKGRPIGIWSIIRDITEQKELQKRLQQHAENMEKLVEERTLQLKDAERLATIGQTAGMVGHDIRNPLQAITSDVYLLKSNLVSMPEGDEKESTQESLEGIEKNVDYINKIVLDLQDYARPLTTKIEEVDLEKIVHTILANLQIPGNVTVKHAIKKGLG